MATRMYVCESAEHPSLLLTGLNEQRLKGVLCDVTVRVQGHLFKAHVNVLASAMGYFRDLFSKSTKEKHEGLIEIPVIVNSTGFAKILDFVYTSQLCLSQSTVMQVLCSACYLQIPYVVEKCQEFIGTHGHATSPSTLSEVTAPLLQDLHRRNFSKPQPPNPITSASASLSLLSQLNRLSEKSRSRLTQQNKSNVKHSPQRGHDTEEQQECELINTPPSPGDHSLTNGEDHRITPDTTDHYPNNRDPSLKVSSVLSLKRERDGDASSNEDKQVVSVYSPQDRFSVCTSVEDRATARKHITSNYAVDSSVGESKHERDTIDHKLLAEYFSTDRERDISNQNYNALSSYPLQLDTSLNQNGFVSSSSTDHHLYSMAKNLNRDRPSDNNNNSTLSFTLHQKKDKPKKEYRCDYCGKMFGRQQHLKRHILTHTGERPYPCQYCDKRFRRSEHLKHHLVSHEQALGVDNQPSRKRQRKMQRVDDAYSLSKLMLDQYGSTDADRGNHIENGAISAAPVILPSMFTDGPPQSSPSAQVMESENVPDNGMNEKALEERKNLGTSSPRNDQSSVEALNLCRVNSKEVEDDKSIHDLSNGHDNVGNISDDLKVNDVDRNSPSSESSSPVNGVNGGFMENNVSSEIIGMEGSEVLTSDLKRLIAAMDE